MWTRAKTGMMSILQIKKECKGYVAVFKDKRQVLLKTDVCQERQGINGQVKGCVKLKVAS